MRITRISVYRCDLPYVGREYRWGAGNVIRIGSTTVVVLKTDAGLTGCGEFCPCGNNYMEAHSEGVEAAAKLLAPKLLGEDPRQVARVERIMDAAIKGHGYAKAPFDAACWDLLGKTTGQPVWMLLGGKLTDGAPMYRVAPQKPPDEMLQEMGAMRRQGYRHFQIKVGSNWAEDIERIHATMPNLRPGGNGICRCQSGLAGGSCHQGCARYA